ncbi:MAG: hypothetical protein L0K86_28935, partial [Actinomycetia bacterium]|nr:hypothetical protein [Actinomycetes bacterium]
MVGALEGAHSVVGTVDQVRGRAHRLQIARGQRRRLVGQAEQLVGIQPCPPQVGLAAPFELNDGVHPRGPLLSD